MQRMRRIRARISRVDSVHRLSAAGVDVFFGEARFTGADALSVDGTTLRFSKAVIATGARPDTPSIPGLAEAGYLTNENVFDLTELPRRLLVIGGGPLGCELAQAFCRFGAQTTIAQDMPLFLPKEERDAAQTPFGRPSRATASRCGSTPRPSGCAWKTARSSSIWSATTTKARWRSMPS